VIGSRNRLRCSAAEGLQALAEHQNSYIPDRLAIIGNLCDFPQRLDTTKLQDGPYSFSTCAFALAILNGDLSLMDCLPLDISSPSSLTVGKRSGQEEASSLVPNHRPPRRLGYSWGPPCNGTLGTLMWVPEATNPRRLTQSIITDEGLSTYGYVFLCDLTIDVPWLRPLYAEEWDIHTNPDHPPDCPERRKLHIWVIWTLVHFLVHKRYYHLAQVIWDHENDFMIRRSHTNSFISQEQTPDEDAPMDLRQLFDFDEPRFIYRRDPDIDSEQDFTQRLAVKPHKYTDFSNHGLMKQTNARRSWLAEAAMSGKLICGRQINTGISLPPASAFTNFDTRTGSLKLTPGIQQPSPQTTSPQIGIDECTPGTNISKSKYTSVFESPDASNKCVFTPNLQSRLNPRETLHTWRPSHWIAERVFKNSAGDSWKVMGGEVVRGAWVPGEMFSSCVLV